MVINANLPNTNIFLIANIHFKDTSAMIKYAHSDRSPAMDTTLFISSMLNLFIAGVFMGLSFVVLRRTEEEGTVLWTDLGKTMVMIAACLVAQSLVVVTVAMYADQTFRLLWFLVFMLFAITGYLVYRYCSRTSKMLEVLLGGGED